MGDVTERQGMVTGLDRNAFRNILHMTFGMTDDMIMDRGKKTQYSHLAITGQKSLGLDIFLVESLMF